MSFFIQDAWANTGAPAGPGMVDIIFLVLLFVVFYFFLIRPQTQKAKEHRLMVDSLAKGDEIITSGGLAAKITAIGDTYISAEIAEGVQVKIERVMVARVLPKGTLKSAI